MMSGCVQNSRGRSAHSWVSRMACWCSLRRRFRSQAASRWAWLGSGAAGWGRLRIAKSGCSWATSRRASTCWWTRGCLFRRKGRPTRRACGRRVCRRGRSAARGMSWPWNCWRIRAHCGLINGLPATMKWAVRAGFSDVCGDFTSPRRRIRRSEQHFDPRSGSRRSVGDWSRPSTESSVAKRVEMGGGSARSHLDQARCARRREGTVGGRSAQTPRSHA